MKIIYCRIGWMNYYDGLKKEQKPINGGEYNKKKIGHEVFNYSCYGNRYYGYARNTSETINVDNLCNSKKNDKAENVLVVWVAKRDNYGEVIIGWYKNATIYRHCQSVPEEVLKQRIDLENGIDETYKDYNIYSEDITLLPIEDRKIKITGFGRANIWYAKSENGKETTKKVIEYINNYENKFENNRENEIIEISQNIEKLVGDEKEVIIKARINQGAFRNIMLNKYKHCCLCGITNKDLLVASHIKPWVKSDKSEKLNEYNGLLLCSMHDKLFDLGYISFNDDGSILISDKLDNKNRMLSNIDENKYINISNDNLTFIQYHRNNIYKK